MPGVGFETTILTFEWAKSVHVLDRAATVIGVTSFDEEIFSSVAPSQTPSIYLYYGLLVYDTALFNGG
jgi:hypothetical protein